MKKKRLLTIFWICMWVVGSASAVEVINIDINNYNNNTGYAGPGPYTGGTETWLPYYGGYGIALGSQRSANLIDESDTAGPSTYAEQVWIGDQGYHAYLTGGTEDTLMEDGFIANVPGTPGSLQDPNIVFLTGRGAYGGVFDMYVISDAAGSFTLTEHFGAKIRTDSLTGTETEGVFELGKNYVVFEDVDNDPNEMRLYYTNQINGIQLVSLKTPVVPVADDQVTTVIDLRNYDVAFDTNNRSGETTTWGPDIGWAVHYLAPTEYMTYDLDISTINGNAGQYSVSMDVQVKWSQAESDIYINNTYIGTCEFDHGGTYGEDGDETIYTTNEVVGNFFANDAAPTNLRWVQPVARYNELLTFNITYVGPLSIEDCNSIYDYGLNFGGDITGDCRVDMTDFLEVAEDWATSYDPAAF